MGKSLDEDKKHLSDYELNFGSGEPNLYLKIKDAQQLFKNP
jgi:hypothetical protein